MGHRRFRKRRHSPASFESFFIYATAATIVFCIVILVVKMIFWLIAEYYLVVIVAIIMFFLYQRHIQQQRVQKLLVIEEVDRLTPDEFEHYLAELFRKKGYHAIVTPHSGDYGADVIIHKGNHRIAIQAKHSTSGSIDQRGVLEVLGSLRRYRCKHGIVITNTTFRKTAIELARDNDIELWNRERLMKEIVHANQVTK